MVELARPIPKLDPCTGRSGQVLWLLCQPPPSPRWVRVSFDSSLPCSHMNFTSHYDTVYLHFALAIACCCLLSLFKTLLEISSEVLLMI